MSPQNGRTGPGGGRFAETASYGTTHRQSSPVLTYLAGREPVRPVCCCCTVETTTTFFDRITPADFDEVYPHDWHPGDEQVAA